MATNVGALSVDFGLDLKGFHKGISDSMKILEDFDRVVSGKALGIGKNIGDNLGKSIGSGIETKTGDINKTIEGIGKDTSSISSTGERIGEDLGAGIKTGLNRSTMDIGKDVFKGMESVGKKGMKMITTPIIAGGLALAKLDSDLNDSIAKVSTISNRKMPELRMENIELSNLRGINASEIAEAQYSSLSAGVSDGNLGAFLEQATMTSKAGFADLDVTIDGLTTTLNSYGMEASRVGEISDQILVTQNLGKATFGEMATSMGNVTPIAAELNVSTKELFSSIAALTKNGIPATKSITSLKAAYSNILKPNQQAIDTAKALGLEFNAAHLKSVGWAKFLDEVKQKTGGNEQAMADLFGSVDALGAMLVLTGKGAGTFNQAMDEMENKSGQTQEAYEKLLTSGEKFRISTNRLKNALTETGGIFEELRDKATSAINSLADSIERLDSGQVETIAKIAGAFALLFPAIFTVGKLGSGLLKLKVMMTLISPVAEGAVAGVGLFSKGMLLAAGKTMIVVGALAFFIKMLWDAEDESAVQAESIGDKFEALGVRMEGMLQMLAGGVLTIVGIFITGVRILITSAMGDLSSFMAKTGDVLESLGADWLSEKFRNGANNIDNASQFLKDANNDYLKLVRDINEGADMKMNKAFTVVQTRRVEKGKIELPDSLKGANLEMYGGNIYGEDGYLTDDVMSIIDKEQKEKKKRELDIGFNFDDFGIPEGMDVFNQEDLDDIDKVVSGLNNTDKQMKATGTTVKSESDKMAEAIKKLGDEFKNTSDSIKGSIGMFDRFKSKTTNSYKLLRNANERNKAINERETILQSLSKKGIDQDIMADLYKTDINQLGDIRGLNRLDENQLKEWVSLQVSANNSAIRQAVEQVVNITINTTGKEQDAEQFAKDIYSRLKRKGIGVY